MIRRTIALMFLVLILVGCGRKSKPGIPSMDLAPGSQREIAYTDKSDAFWVTRSGGYNNSPWHGLTASKRQYFEDLFIYADGELLPREAAELNVDPIQLRRNYSELGIRETWTLVDHARSLLVLLESKKARTWTLQPAVLGGNLDTDFEIRTAPQTLSVKLLRMSDLPSAYSFLNLQFTEPVEWLPAEDPGKSLYSAHLIARATHVKSKNIAILISLANEPAGDFFDTDWAESVQADRRKRIMEQSLNTRFESDRRDIDAAIAWAQASLDALIMDQMGVGIYAGLPWFDDYWGRDEFISFSGAVLVNGKFETARQILESFAELQNRDPDDPNYGRIPNRAQPQDIIYNTADGTPWFVRSVWDYFRYSGDEAFLKTMWPSIELATEGALQYWTDESGLLRHADADTWMDARGPEGPWSPRGDRAIEIQFLWRDQLEITQQLAYTYAVDDLGDECQETLMALETGIQQFRQSRRGPYADHLNADGSRDAQLRPNVFLVPPLFYETCDWETFRDLAPRLVSPNGVLSLAQRDPNFHPYHHRPGLYVKDAAYHNGIIWTWNSAAVISPAIHFHQYHYAQALFEDLTDQILNRGAIGSISELTDAWPRNGALELSGTFSQAWSLAEYLRVFYQDILGVQPDLAKGQVRLSPRLAEMLNSVDFVHPVGKDSWQISYRDNTEAFEIQIERDSSLALTLITELMVNEQLAQVSFPWTRKSLQLRYEKQMKQWTVPGSVGEYEQSVEVPDLPINGLPFCELDTTLKVPALAGPGHPLLKAEQVLPGSETVRSLLVVQDSAGDDVGPGGQYVYPANPQFEAGIVDIQEFRLGESDDDYHFEIKFANLVDPGWHPETGYQLTYCAVAFDHDPQGGSRNVGMNAQARFRDSFRADNILYISGNLKLVDGQNQNLAEYIPMDRRGAIGSAQTDMLRFKLPKALFNGDLSKAKVQIAVGLQDDHGGAGLGDFREVQARSSEWSGGGKLDPAASNIYDWLLFEG